MAPKSMTTVRSTANASKAARLEQIRAELNQRWIEQELERLNEVFLAALKAVMAHCEQLRSELANQQLLEQETEAQLTFADKLRLKLGVPYSAVSMSAAAQQLPLIREHIAQLQEDITLNSPGAKPSTNGRSSMLLTAIEQNDRAVKLASASNNSTRSTWVEEQLQNQLLEERNQLADWRREASQAKARRRASRSYVELTVKIEGQNGMLEGTTRDISDTGVFVELQDADKTFIEGELLTVQVSGLPAEATAVRGVAVRVGPNGLGVRLLSAKNSLRPPENQDETP